MLRSSYLKWSLSRTGGTYIEEASSREGKNPGSSGLKRVNRVQGEGGQRSEHPNTGCPNLSLSSLPPKQPAANITAIDLNSMSPREAAFQQYREIANLVRNLVYQYGEGRDEAHFEGCQETENCLIISVAFV